MYTREWAGALHLVEKTETTVVDSALDGMCAGSCYLNLARYMPMGHYDPDTNRIKHKAHNTFIPMKRKRKNPGINLGVYADVVKNHRRAYATLSKAVACHGSVPANPPPATSRYAHALGVYSTT